MTITSDAITTAIDRDVALVCLTHVAFKSAFMYDMNDVTTLAHQNGALVLWDLSHSVGAVPFDLNACQVDLAVGCTYKYLNGGPGAPAFLYVRRDLQDRLLQPIWGWFSAKDPFAFDLSYNPAKNINRFLIGTPPVLSLMAIGPAIDLLLQAGISRLRAKSILQTEYLIYLAEQWLLPLGFSLGSPRQAELRGSHVSLRHPEGYRIVRALIEPEATAVRVIPDFRAPDSIRLGIAPLYISFVDIHSALQRIRSVMQGKEYERFTEERLSVT
jgi:kynureninase